jgi:hypothetical protein
MLKLTRAFILTLASVVFILSQHSSASARSTIQLTIVKTGFIFGIAGGNGVLNYNGTIIPLSVGGVSLGATLGISQADLVGTVYNLRNPADIEGAYSGAGAGLSVVGGRRVATLQNAKGVVLKVRGRQVGFIFSLDLGGMTISLRR